ncbi:protein lin-28 homolog A-like [Anopheles merus]|uniref:protein lin-28 homolog A-like n=1 Tax=Anopheles merus TaxID=30066 RepID=UPI001BE45476|nr:protein lin-28 homolog A-like [Anopheles merus]XP_041765742.1 protein lin-28 homolog A-like [Anopheles merus]
MASVRFAATSMDTLKQLLKKCETYRATAPLIPVTSTIVNKQHDISKENYAAPRCYNCRKMGHTQNQCRLPARPPGSCFRCHKEDHIYQNCPQRVQQAAATMHVIDSEEEEPHNNQTIVKMNAHQES